MTDAAKPNHTIVPPEGARLEPRGYYLLAVFHPSLPLNRKSGFPLNRKSGFEFAAKLTDYVDPSHVNLGEEQWSFEQPITGSPQSRLRVIIRANQIEIHAEFPFSGQEWFENRVAPILGKFAEAFKPNFLLQTKSMIRGVLPIDGDARAFLADHVMRIDPRSARRFGRPIHLVGLRLFLPPFQEKTQDGSRKTDWGLNIRVESLMEDPRTLFLEAEADWPEPMAWDNDTITKLVERLQTVGDYLQNNVITFLRASESEQEADG